MNTETAQKIFNEINRARHEELKSGVKAGAVRYAQMRAECALSSTEHRREIDASRTRAHDVFIDACNILSRAQAHSGEDNHWRTALANDRKVIGDLACFIHLFLGLSAR